MKTALIALGALALATPAEAQRQRHATAYGSDWGYFQYETGAGNATILTGRPMMHEGHPEAVITLMSRDGRALSEGDRPQAIAIARVLCERSGRQFNTRTRGHWLNNGGLSFDGACTRW